MVLPNFPGSKGDDSGNGLARTADPRGPRGDRIQRAAKLVVHHSKIDRRMAEMGHFPSPAAWPAATGAPQKPVTEAIGCGVGDERRVNLRREHVAADVAARTPRGAR
jgi:hypothetical protein